MLEAESATGPYCGLERSGQLKSLMTSSVIEPTTFRLKAFVLKSSQEFAKGSKDFIPFRGGYGTNGNIVLFMVRLA
jgi:hypothetical protein